MMFSNEKLFYLNGTEGYKYYWHHVGSMRKSMVSIHSAGKYVMVWPEICAYGKTNLAFDDSNMNTQRYTNVLEEYLIPFAQEQYSLEYSLMQDNASVYIAAVSNSWFETHLINVIEWSAYSADINSIENIWGAFARMLYGNG